MTVLVTHARASLPGGMPLVALSRFLVSSFYSSFDIDFLPALFEFTSMELDEVVHVHWWFASDLVHGVRHAVVTPVPGQLGHRREMSDHVVRKLCLPKAFAPRRCWDVAISDGSAECLGEYARIVVQIGRFGPVRS